MNYSIKIADLSQPGVNLALRNLVKSAYNNAALIPEKFLTANIESHASKKSFFLVAEESGNIIGCNAFIANDFILNGLSYTGYQSCWSVTHPDHEGKQVFSSLINEAKKILKAEGAGFLYGIANNKSNPIITKKLGFAETAALRLRIPNIPLFRNLYIAKICTPNIDQACCISEAQVLERKMNQFPETIKVFRCGESWLWGKAIRKKKYGIRWPVFYVGGVHIATANGVKDLLAQVFKSQRIAFVQLLSCSTNSFNPMLKGWKRPDMNGFIFYNLNMPDFRHFNLMIGAMDIF